jgi:signal peptidase I
VSAAHVTCVTDALAETLRLPADRLECNVSQTDDDATVELEITVLGIDQGGLDSAVRRSLPACARDPLQCRRIEAHTTEQPARAPAVRSRRLRVAEVVRVLAIALGIFIGIRSVVQTFRVDGPSMVPTFQNGQSLIVFRPAYWHVDGTPFDGLLPIRPQGSIHYVFGGPRRGDLVVFRPPGDSNFESDLVKRIIGLPGDVVSIRDGEVVVNGTRLVEPYVVFPADYTYPGGDLGLLVPNDSYFVLGDNRPASADSHLGWLVPAEKLLGQAVLSYWPPNRWGFVPRAEVRAADPPGP